MKKLLLCFVLSGFLSHAQSPGKIRRALFIGNSYTFFNNLPNLVQQLAEAAGDSLVVDSYAPGGYTFANHAADPSGIAKIQSGSWDFVILQAQSQEPSFSPAQVNAQTLPFALKLDSLVKAANPCGQTVFFETWGRKFGDASNCAVYPPVCTYQGMQNRLKQSYKLFADLSSSLMAPVGEAFRESIARDPNLELYTSDQSHPALTGSYLAASMFYECLFQRSVVNNAFHAALTPTLALFLQQVAHDVLRDSLAVWNFGWHYPWADFELQSNSPAAIQLSGFSPGLNNIWYFGDGNQSLLPSPSHSYSVSGTYTISHVVSQACAKDSAVKVFQVSLPVGLQESFDEPPLWVYPNPAMDRVRVLGPEACRIILYNLQGQIVAEQKSGYELDLRALPEGYYNVFVQSKTHHITRPLLIHRP